MALFFLLADGMEGIEQADLKELGSKDEVQRDHRTISPLSCSVADIAGSVTSMRFIFPS